MKRKTVITIAACLALGVVINWAVAIGAVRWRIGMKSPVAPVLARTSWMYDLDEFRIYSAPFPTKSFGVGWEHRNQVNSLSRGDWTLFLFQGNTKCGFPMYSFAEFAVWSSEREVKPSGRIGSKWFRRDVPAYEGIRSPDSVMSLAHNVKPKPGIIVGAFRGTTTVLPLGFLVNSLLYAGILFVPIVLPGWMRKRRRIRRGHCPKCNYDIQRGAFCPECGWTAEK